MTTHAATSLAVDGSLDDVSASVNLMRHGRRRGNRGLRRSRVLSACVLALVAVVAGAEDLLVGTMPDGNGARVAFGLKGESREDVVGGRIVIGETEYEISRVSRLGLIGARRFVNSGDAQEPYAEFLVLSSSFNEQTAVGKPWPAVRESYGCGEPYNTFIAHYRVVGDAEVKALGPIPYPKLVEDSALSHASRVLCFDARPPD